jgi:hypothetical protein
MTPLAEIHSHHAMVNKAEWTITTPLSGEARSRTRVAVPPRRGGTRPNAEALEQAIAILTTRRPRDASGDDQNADIRALHRGLEELGWRVQLLEASLKDRDHGPSVQTGVTQLAEHFAELAFALQQVQRVILVADDGDLTIWTVIDAEPFDRGQRYPVYVAQARALSMTDCDFVDFRLVNLREFGSDAANVVPRAEVIWERSRPRDAAAL